MKTHHCHCIVLYCKSHRLTRCSAYIVLICIVLGGIYRIELYCIALQYSLYRIILYRIAVYIVSSPESKAYRLAYSILMVCRPSSVRPSSTMLKHLLRNRLADQSQILYRASLGWGNEGLFSASWSHDQDGRHAHIW